MNKLLAGLRQGNDRKHGFTILELLVATIVFSVVLLLVTAGIMQIARVYYKGVTESNTQNAARSIIDNISQAIQFSGGAVTETDPPMPGEDEVFCIGSQHFSYRLGWQVEDNPNSAQNQAWHGLVQRPLTGSCTGAQDMDNENLTGRDLVPRHMRLTKLSVEDMGGNQYRVQVRVVYGDNDLLTIPATGADVACRSQSAGTQFCSISELSTTVVKRVK